MKKKTKNNNLTFVRSTTVKKTTFDGLHIFIFGSAEDDNQYVSISIDGDTSQFRLRLSIDEFYHFTNALNEIGEDLGDKLYGSK